MRKSLILLALIFIAACAVQKVESQKLVSENKLIADQKIAKPTVLVELFTAAGCPSCPLAEKVLRQLETEQPFEDAELITLAFHVDYWDGFGLKDKYASQLFTQRQRAYDRKFQTGKIYTPQMIVDGDIEFVGSKMDRAEKAVKRSVQNEKASILLEAKDERLTINIPNIPKHKDATVYMAIAEDVLSSHIRKEKNTLKDQTNVSVVRHLKALGRILTKDDSFEIETGLGIQPDWKIENLKIIVFVQENVSRKILGVEKLKKMSFR